MPSDGTIIITDVGHAKLNTAVATASKVEITHVAMGDGLGAVYEPGFGQTALRRERARVPIKSQHIGGVTSWRITAEFGADTTPQFWVREIGFFDGAGALILLWAGADISSRQTGAIDYLLDQVLVLDRIKDGVLIVTAPPDDLFDLSVASATTFANLQLQQLRQADQLRRLTGTF